MNVTFYSDRPFCAEGKQAIVEGSTITFTCGYWGVPSSVSAKVYKGGSSEVTSTVMPAGTVTVSGNNATLKPLTALVGGFDYVIDVTATVGSDIFVRKIQVTCSRAKDVL